MVHGDEFDGEVLDDWWAQFFHMKHGFGLGVASLKVSLARLDLSDTDLPSLTAALEKLLQHLRDEAPGTLRHVSCCGAEYEQYSSVNKEDIEILPD